LFFWRIPSGRISQRWLRLSPRERREKRGERELIRGPLQAADCLHAQALGDVFAFRIRRFLVDHPRLELDSVRPSAGHRSEYVENPYNCKIYARHRSREMPR